MSPLTQDKKTDMQDNESINLEKIETLIKSSRELYITDPNLAKTIIDKAYILSRSLKYDYGMGESLRVKGNVYWAAGDYEQAVKSLIRARQFFEKLEDNERLTLVFKSLGRVYHSLSDTGNSLRFYHLALDTAELDQNNDNIANCSYGLGFAYYHILDYQKALTYFQKGMVRYEIVGDKFGMAIGYNNFADVCMKISDGEKALEFAIKAYELLIESKRNNEGHAAEFYITIGDAYPLNNNLKSASEYFDKALEIAKKTDYKEGQIFSNIKIGELKIKENLYHDARIYLKRAMKLAHETCNISEERKCIDLLTKLNG